VLHYTNTSTNTGLARPTSLPEAKKEVNIIDSTVSLSHKLKISKQLDMVGKMKHMWN
jgi:hypothetical protein